MPAPEAREVSAPDEMTLLAAVAGLLLANGQTTEGTRLAVERLASSRGRTVTFAARWGEYVLQARDAVLLEEVAPTGVDIGRVSAVEAVAAAARGGIGAVDALARLAAIRQGGPVALARFVPMAAAGAAALGVIFGASDLPTIVLIAASAAGGALLRRGVSHASDNPFLQPLAASVLAGLIGGLAARFHLPATDRLVMACPCMVLVPGPHLLNGALDLARARIPIGAGRIGLALLVIVAICGGLLAGLALVGASFPPAGARTEVPFGADALAAGIAVAAYGSFFNMPWRMMPAPIVIGMAAHALRWLMLHHGASPHLGAFGATLLAGGVTAPLARRFSLPFGASAFAAVVALIPGVFMFDAASALLAAVDLGSGADPTSLLLVVSNGGTALIITLAMAAGLVLPKLFYDAVWPENHPRSDV